MTESPGVVTVPYPAHTIQNDLGEETTPLLRYGQSAWLRNFLIVCLVILFCVGLSVGIYLLYTESDQRTLYMNAAEAHINTPQPKLKKLLVADSDSTVKKDSTIGLIHYFMTKIKSVFGWFRS